MKLSKSDLPYFLAIRLSLFLVLGFISACRQEVNFHPVRPQHAIMHINHLGTYSSKVEEEKEVEGTVFQTNITYVLDKKNTGWSLRRHTDSLIAVGYHKKSLATELEKKINLDLELGNDFIPTHIAGYDSIYKVFGRIEQKDSYKAYLLAHLDTLFFQAEIRDRFRLLNILPEGKIKADTLLSVEKINTQLESIKLDSLRFQGARPRLRRDCIEYEAFYHRQDSLPLMVEQMLFSAPKNRRFRHDTWSPGKVEGIWHFSLDLKTGLSCFESRTEIGALTLKNKEEKIETPILLYRYDEDIFN